MTRAPCIVVVCGLALTACGSKAETKGGAGAAASGSAGGRRAVSFNVEVQKVTQQRLGGTIVAPGILAAFEQVQVVARVAGAIDRVSFAEGGEVKKGQILVIIDSERFGVTVNLAKVAVDRAEAAQKGAEADLKRRQGAIEGHPGLIPGEELATYETKVLTAKADTASARANFNMANLNLRDAFVRAPMAGIIQTRTVETGQYVATGAVLATLLQRDPLLLRFSVQEEEAPRLKVGMIAKLKLREAAHAADAKITLIAGAADPKTHLVPITAEVQEKEHLFWLRPGAYCEVAVEILDEVRQGVVIPEIAVRPSEKGFLVYVVEGGLAKPRLLKLGMHTADGKVEVKKPDNADAGEGLKPGELLVVRGAEPLYDGAMVKMGEGKGGGPAGSAASSSSSEAAPSASASAPAHAPSAGAHDGGGGAGGKRGPRP